MGYFTRRGVKFEKNLTLFWWRFLAT